MRKYVSDAKRCYVVQGDPKEPFFGKTILTLLFKTETILTLFSKHKLLWTIFEPKLDRFSSIFESIFDYFKIVLNHFWKTILIPFSKYKTFWTIFGKPFSKYKPYWTIFEPYPNHFWSIFWLINFYFWLISDLFFEPFSTILIHFRATFQPLMLSCWLTL